MGKHLVSTLRLRGAEVLSLVHSKTGAADSSVRTLEEVLRAPSAFDGVDVVVHTAAVRHRHGVDEQSYRSTNVDLVEELEKLSPEE